MADGPHRHGDDPGYEIRRQNKTKPTVVAVAIAAVVAVLLVRDPGGSFDDGPVTTTIPLSEQTTTTAGAAPLTLPADETTPEVDDSIAGRGLGVQNGDAFTFRWGRIAYSSHPARSLTVPEDPALIATDDLLALVGDGGDLVVGGDEQAFRSVACCFDGVVASNEPRHVWAHDDQSAWLIDLDDGTTVTELALDGRRILGPGPFGLVAVDSQERAVWLRPGFEAIVVDAVPAGRVPISAGGPAIAYLVSGAQTVEVRRLTDGALFATFADQGSVHAWVSSSGSAVAVRGDDATVVYDVSTGIEVGRLAVTDGNIVSIGGRRFAAADGDLIIDSNGSRRGVAAGLLVLATRAE